MRGTPLSARFPTPHNSCKRRIADAFEWRVHQNGRCAARIDYCACLETDRTLKVLRLDTFNENLHAEPRFMLATHPVRQKKMRGHWPRIQEV